MIYGKSGSGKSRSLKNFAPDEGCEWGCDNYEDFKPAKLRMVEFAKEHDISVADLIALIEMG